ncbi:protein MAIN-LIKE 1-like [Vicia villosa]|uniref:protein MAIN-LIKE 1-like n=1 Tax=Vicia villosa TaxID=3911 RepID=UPI00273B13BC|nr:protein MAIN-LIKE 1-like [Vicia villosa]
MAGSQALAARLRQGRKTQTASARRERAAQQAMIRGRGQLRVLVQMDDSPAGSSFASRSRMSRASSSREEEERATIKSVNHGQKIFDLFQPQAQWFNDVVGGSELGGLCMIGYSNSIHKMYGAIAERWQKETSSFHFPVGELTITLHDLACLLHLPIIGSLLDHSQIQMVKAIEWMVDYLGMDPNMADYECRATRGAHIRFSSLKEL